MSTIQRLFGKLAQASILIFIAFTVLVGFKSLSIVDVKATMFLQTLIPRFFDYPFSLLSLIGSFEITSALLVVIFISRYGKNLTPTLSILSLFILGTIAELSGKLYLFHPSPPKLFFRNVGILFPTTYVHTNYSYPSGHMFRVAFITVLLIYFLLKTKRGVPLIVTLAVFLLIMATSRIYLGEHWLSDVVGGTLLGAFFGALSTGFLKNHKYSTG